MGLGPPHHSNLSSSSSERHCNLQLCRLVCATQQVGSRQMQCPRGLCGVAVWKRPRDSPILQVPTLSRTDGTCKIKQEAENLVLTEIRNVSSLRASPWARSAGMGALQGRRRLFQSNSGCADKGPRYAASAGVCLVWEPLALLSLLCASDLPSYPCQTHGGSSGLRGCSSRQHLLWAFSLMN